jgi:hypothetical protein
VKPTALNAGIVIFSFVFGLVPYRSARSWMSKGPKPYDHYILQAEGFLTTIPK